MLRLRPIALGLVVTLLASCGSPAVSPSGLVPGPSPPATASALSSSTPPAHDPLPLGFPVFPGSTPAPLPADDPGLIGRWVADLAGSAAYDFYLSALPTAGYRIVGAYPGGAAAVIRFSLPDGATWQVVIGGGADDAVVIEVRVDRP